MRGNKEKLGEIKENEGVVGQETQLPPPPHSLGPPGQLLT